MGSGNRTGKIYDKAVLYVSGWSPLLLFIVLFFSFSRAEKTWSGKSFFFLQAEMELRICQSLFDRQSEITRQAVEGINNTHVRWTLSWWLRLACIITRGVKPVHFVWKKKRTDYFFSIVHFWAIAIVAPTHVLHVLLFFQTNHMRSLAEFVDAQACFFDQCNQHAQELQKQLARSVHLLHKLLH